MRRSLASSTLAAVAAMVAASAAYAAEPPPIAQCTTVRTVNKTSSKVWITIYDLAKLRHLDYGWVDACSYRDWRAGNYFCGSHYHVRGEVKNADLSQNLYDTTMQFSTGMTTSDSQVTVQKGTGNYYWTKGSIGWDPESPTPRPSGCETTAPQGAGQYTINFKNTVVLHVIVSVQSRSGGARMGEDQCVGPGQSKTWKVAPAGEYSIITSVVAGSTCPGPAMGGAILHARANSAGVVSAELGFQLLAK